MTTSGDFRGEGAFLGKTLHVQGELSGDEDFTIEGEVRGTIHLPNQRLTVGPLGKVQANVTAREVVVYGQLQGHVQAQDRVEIKKSGSVLGDMKLARISIEDGAYFKGNIDIQLRAGAVPAPAGGTVAPSAPAALPAAKSTSR
ncbi:MAG: bactofilin family protein [Terriglobales bacterium]